MKTITEIIPDRKEWPDWAKEAFDSGQFFNVVDEKFEQLKQERDIRETRECLLGLIAVALGVSTDPHQTFDERLLAEAHIAGSAEAAFTFVGELPNKWLESIDGTIECCFHGGNVKAVKACANQLIAALESIGEK